MIEIFQSAGWLQLTVPAVEDWMPNPKSFVEMTPPSFLFKSLNSYGILPVLWSRTLDALAAGRVTRLYTL